MRSGRGGMEDPAGPGCGCAAAKATEAIGPGAKAAGVDPAIKEANLKHLRRIEGQVRGIAAMVEGDRYCADVLMQVAAARESLHAVARNLMRNHLKHCASAAMRADEPARDAMIDELLDMVARIGR